MRLDKWLWAARFIKTRATAVEAIEAGHVTLNGERPKPAKLAKVGDSVVVRRPPFEHVVVVKDLSDKRGPAAAAALLYEETPESRAKPLHGVPSPLEGEGPGGGGSPRAAAVRRR